ncbi:37S ribosomal protein S16, mitochondrial [Coemansia sp. RSA 1086]|nr:37S ribosomal protein S16, mitochondrial [Coemansia sp. RSA 1086]
MAVRIRFARHGVRNNPFFHIVAINARKKRDGKPLEKLGTYSPHPNIKEGAKHITLDFARTKYWLGVGAQPTDGVRFLLERAGLLPPRPLHPKVKRSPAAAAAAASSAESQPKA